MARTRIKSSPIDTTTDANLPVGTLAHFAEIDENNVVLQVIVVKTNAVMD